MGGDLAAIAIAEKLSARRCVMLGLHAPQEAVLRIIEESRPKETSTDRIEAALNALIEDRSRNSAPVVEVDAHAEKAPSALEFFPATLTAPGRAEMRRHPTDSPALKLIWHEIVPGVGALFAPTARRVFASAAQGPP
jgi:hypothetical protein